MKSRPVLPGGFFIVCTFHFLHSPLSLCNFIPTFAFLKEFCFNEKRYAETTSIGLDAL